MKSLFRKREGESTEPALRARVFRQVAEIARKEAIVALPAAKRAAVHGAQAFLKKFSEEYTKERRRR